MKYTLPEARTLTQEAQDAHNRTQEAVTKFFEENILPIKDEGKLTFSYKNSEISDTFTAEEFIPILEEHGYEVSYGSEGKLLNLYVKNVAISGRASFSNFFDDEKKMTLLNGIVEDRMTIYWEGN